MPRSKGQVEVITLSGTPRPIEGNAGIGFSLHAGRRRKIHLSNIH
jgi:hypothetical protein